MSVQEASPNAETSEFHTKKTSSKYRKDIDGIRGIAVFMVVIFHAAPLWLPGGFIGVDVFFVISGFLISSIIFREVSEDRFSLVDFYARRVKRIFPALATMLIAVLLFGWLFQFGSEFRNLGKHVLGGTTFISNLLFWRETGYFNSAAEAKPLLHLWSLGIEEQFYIFFPIGVWLLRKVTRANRTAAIAIALLISFGLSLVGTETRPVATFYLPVTRVWEMLIGCLLASSVRQKTEKEKVTSDPKRPNGSALTNLSGAMGLLMISIPALLITADDAFPGLWALMPTVGTALIIWAGDGCRVNQIFLCNRLLVAVGLISYPLYLWHWPALYFTKIMSGGEPSANAIFGAVVFSVVLSGLTFFYIERPIRFGRIFGSKTVATLCTLVALISVVGGLAFTNLLPSRLASHPLAKEYDLAINDWAYTHSHNFQRSRDFEVFNPSESVQKPERGSVIVFIGDSHMEQYWPRVKHVQEHLGATAPPIRFVTAGGSPTLPNVNSIYPGYSCHKFYQFCIQEASKSEVGRVVFCCYWEGNFPSKGPGGLYRVGDVDRKPLAIEDATAKQVFEEFGKDIGHLADQGKEVFVILAAPSSGDWAPVPISRFSTASEVLGRLPITESEIANKVGPIERAIVGVVESNGGKIIRPRQAMLENGRYFGRSVDKRYRYKDSHHMRPYYVKEVATFIDALLDPPHIPEPSNQ